MVDIRFKDLDEAAVPGEDYWIPSDSETDGVKKIKPSNLVSASDIGLGNVDNTSDADKPISDATQTALDGKATTAQGAKADSAVQPGDLGDLAAKDQAAISDIDATGTPSSTTALFGDGTWKVPAGGGDMVATTYDPDNVGANAFDSANQAWIQDGTGAITRAGRAKMRDICDLRDFASTFDGVVDNTTDFNHALAQAVSANKEFKMPGGIIRLTSAISVPQNAKIIGSGAGNAFDASNAPIVPSAAQGTWLHFDHAGVGMLSDDHLVGASDGSRLFKNFGTFRSQPAPNGGAFTPGTFDFDFWCQSTVDVMFDRLMILNASKGFYVAQSGTSSVVSGRTNFSRIIGQPLNLGIAIDYSYDVCRIENVHFWPYWSRGAEVYDYTANNAVGVSLGRCDNPYLDKLFFYAYRKGISFGSAPDTDDAPGGACGNFSIGIFHNDFGGSALVVESGVDAVTGRISDMNAYSAGADVNPAVTLSPGVMLLGTNADIRVGSLKAANGQARNATVAGSGNLLRVEQMTSLWANQASGGYAHIDVASGNVVAIGPRPKLDTSGSFWSGSGTMDCVMGQGNSTGTTDGSGDTTFSHGLGAAPGRVLVNITSEGSNLFAYVRSITSTSVTFRSYGSTNGEVVGSGAALTFDWAAYG